MTMLSVENLDIYLKDSDKRLVHQMSFEVQQGESLILLGQSGSGKTMTCRAIMSLLDDKKFIKSGKVLFENKELIHMPPKARQKIYGGEIAFIPQNPMTALNPSIKVGKQMEETLLLHRDIPKKEALMHMLEALKSAGLHEGASIINKYPFELSGGMLQRVIIAMAIMVKAKLIIADEPTTALDVVHRNAAMDELCSMKKQGVAIMMVTHDFVAASKLGGNLVIMKGGRIIEKGKVIEVLQNPKHSYTKALIKASSLSSSI